MTDSGPAKKRSFGWILWVFVVLVVIYLFPSMVYWPPPWIERRAQRQRLNERIQSAGGWAALQRDCDTLVQQNRTTGFAWHQGDELPPALAALNPREVYFYPSPNRKDSSAMCVVHIRVLGVHSTGGHSTPYFGLEVVSGGNADQYRPEPGRGAPGNYHDSYRKVTDRIYEIY
jgi:hypothetical protein